MFLQKKKVSALGFGTWVCGIWVGEEHLLMKKVKTQSWRAASY